MYVVSTVYCHTRYQGVKDIVYYVQYMIVLNASVNTQHWTGETLQIFDFYVSAYKNMLGVTIYKHIDHAMQRCFTATKYKKKFRFNLQVQLLLVITNQVSKHACLINYLIIRTVDVSWSVDHQINIVTLQPSLYRKAVFDIIASVENDRQMNCLHFILGFNIIDGQQTNRDYDDEFRIYVFEMSE